MAERLVREALRPVCAEELHTSLVRLVVVGQTLLVEIELVREYESAVE